MTASAMSYVYGKLFQEIPKEILDVTFEPIKNQTTIENAISEKVIFPRVLQDTNLTGGFRRQIEISNDWLLDTQDPNMALMAGSTVDYAFYLIPPEAREYRNISSIRDLYMNYPFSMPMDNMGDGGNTQIFGNSVMSLAQAALTSRTFADVPTIPPQVTLREGNIIRIYPQTYLSGLILDCDLEFDPEYTNISRTMIPALRDLIITATTAYIFNYLRIKIDINEVIAGYEIGAFKDVVMEYADSNVKYDEMLDDWTGANLMDPEKFPDLAQVML